MSSPTADTARSRPALAPLAAIEAVAPLQALAARGGVLAMLTGTEGSYYRPCGAMIAFPEGAEPVGQLSGGCIEGDLALHAAEVGRSRQPRQLRYGRGSDFVDIRLPCGGGIDVTLVPVAPGSAIAAPLESLLARRETTLRIEGLPALPLFPDPMAYVLGEGAEAEAFLRVAQAAGYPTRRAERVDPAEIDRFTAIVLFFHDHDREPELLLAALDSPAFWIGAQGSRQAQARRRAALLAAGCDAAALDRLRGPIGLIPGARNARMLAVSVLAEIVETAGRVMAPGS
ncbi:XdhC family protein [Limimaricola pyoseonensis]|uniref:Xanthine dehydrogenase accessory factor n=1 Tax=Limimaricola pyoseonensis TaxID=521013 RepID=A0A1G7JIG5_9RHOB|nr:XdhC family protein [Limimaricola pyoseonensis]SDF24574.1 xanthine dehydrogenase accessory factor [Limimaricola pyoseonensis]